MHPNNQFNTTTVNRKELLYSHSTAVFTICHLIRQTHNSNDRTLLKVMD